jgi:hypothetical protein
MLSNHGGAGGEVGYAGELPSQQKIVLSGRMPQKLTLAILGFGYGSTLAETDVPPHAS